MKTKGTLFLTEGIDGCGKSSVAEFLAAHIQSLGYDAVIFSEPTYDLPHGKLLRSLLASGEYPESHAALFLADRMAQEPTILKELDAGKVVILVRSFISTLAYQQEHHPLWWLEDIHLRMKMKPDVVIWLDVEPKEGLRRVQKRGIAQEVYEKLDIQERNHKRYSSLMENIRGQPLPPLDGFMTPDGRVWHIDANKSFEDVCNDITQRFKEYEKWMKS